MTVALLDAARRYAQRGIPVFPCAPNGKRPITTRGLYDASTDPALLWRWWTESPRANIAIPTGARSGLLVVDLDVKRGVDGHATLEAAERDLGRLPRTIIVSTPSGGEHRYFRAPLDVVIRNSAGKLAGEDAPGLDVRGEGGYVLAPPSSIDGMSYLWSERFALAELPAAWIEALSPPRPALPSAPPWQPNDARDRTRVEAWCARALQEEARELASAPPGTRNDRLWRAAAALGGLVHTGAIDASEIRRALTWACSQWRERTPRKDVDTLERGLAFGISSPRRLDLGDRDAA